ncbi:MAG: ABC transporter ATP-binding protein [Lachnospiraceae bacterium]|jgi:peptide/nickel transport system ATP-binding protein|nr:ABC transporter ATP-binding protein [Lachnospiraceae bacterium]NBJ81800.1 ABC transporter ATP-binding protein [bacterium 1XD42-76]NBK05244.1 ABC transporter ATP-binding protein [bacterium 1XD42-94]
MSADNGKTVKSEESTFLDVRDLTVQYTSMGSVIHAVNGITFQLKKGETLALVGETGAGKTSIAKAILRILPDVSAKSKGTVIFNNTDLMQMKEKEMQKIRGHKISMIFQDPMTALNPTMRVGKQISEVISAHRSISTEEAVAEGKKMLEMVGIPAERYYEFPHQFSGGMKQRVVIAIALACNPELLLADEPTTALDVTIQAQVLELINDLKERLNTSMILITHDLGVVNETCDNVAVIYAGRIIESGSKYDVFKHPGHPYTNGLFGALPNMNLDSDRLSPIAGLLPDPTNLPDGCAFAPRCPYVTDKCRQGTIPAVEVEPGHFCECIRMDEIRKER